MVRRRKVCVLGAGVLGLASALHIQESTRDVDVTIIADKLSPNTTSDGCVGFWIPFSLGETSLKLVHQWSSETWDHLMSLFNSTHAKDVGVQLLSGYLLYDSIQEDPDWKDKVIGFRHLTSDELKQFSSSKWGVFFTTVQIHVRLYLPWLMKRFKANGGRIIVRKLNSLDEVSKLDYDVIVNCCGLGSGILFGDTEVFPNRGQTVRVQATWVKHFYIAVRNGLLSNVIPGSEDTVIGGTTQAHDWNEEVDETDKQAIWQRAVDLVPGLQMATVDSHWTGLRPSRTRVRLEVEEIQAEGRKLLIIHNYGHGGAGVTLHWGCGQHAAELVTDVLKRLDTQSKL